MKNYQAILSLLGLILHSSEIEILIMHSYIVMVNLSMKFDPDHLRDDWNKINKQLKSIFTSCIESKIDLKQNCFYDFAPKRFLIEYCNIRNQITEYVLNNVSKPKQYDFYKKFTELLTDIKHRELNINLDNIQNKLYKESAISFYKKIANGKQI